ncbi:MAG: hypothetical protein Q4C91_07710 [Eubacteriales bacterium]|nr:hypothetical protein [Eubacteriales bacterium]
MFPKKTDKRVLRLIPDYKINLLTPAGIDDPDFEKFRTGFGAAMKYIKYSNNKKELKRVLEENREFWTVDRETAKVIEAVTGTDLRIKESEVYVNVCKAVEDLQRDAEIKATIKTYRKCKYTDESIIKEIMAEFQLYAEEAKQFVEEKNLALA